MARRIVALVAALVIAAAPAAATVCEFVCESHAMSAMMAEGHQHCARMAMASSQDGVAISGAPDACHQLLTGQIGIQDTRRPAVAPVAMAVSTVVLTSPVRRIAIVTPLSPDPRPPGPAARTSQLRI